MEVEWKKYYAGFINGPDGPFKIRLIHRDEDCFSGEWTLLGEPCNCGMVQSFACGKLELETPLPPVEFLATLKEVLVVGEGWGNNHWESLLEEVIVHFSGIKWNRVFCNSDSIFCSGQCDFDCERWSVEEDMEETCEEPLLVGVGNGQ
jgi:hypothetical protein